jgi:hypothetical protein
MISGKTAIPALLNKRWKTWRIAVRLRCSKNSFKNNTDSSDFFHSPLVGYYRLSSVIKTFTTSHSLFRKPIRRSANSIETPQPDVEISNEHTLGCRHYMGYFSLWPIRMEAGFYVLCLPIEKLLFDILKNLVTFTPSNHCMYGGKRYN